MRIAVTGASGFVGGHLLDFLSSKHEVVAISRASLEVPEGVQNCVSGPIDSSTDWRGILTDVDAVVHLAARVHVMNEDSENPLESFREVNLRGTERLAKACVDQGVKRLVFMSSIKVNGESTLHKPFTSGDDPAPVDPYGISKYEAEQSLLTIARDTNLEVAILRPPVIYGRGVKGNIERLAKLVKTGAPIPTGAIANRRTMVSISNLMRWIEAVLVAEVAPQASLLVGDPTPVSTRELVRWLSEGQGRRSRQLFVPVSLLKVLGTLSGKRSVVNRLVEDLEVEPDFSRFPHLKSKMETPRQGLSALTFADEKPGDRE